MREIDTCEELLKRVRDLEQTLAEERAERLGIEETLRAIAVSGAAPGEVFFRFVVRKLAETQRFRCAVLAEVRAADPDTAHTLQVWSKGRFIDNFSYALAGTPCADVAKTGHCFFPRDVRRLFPEDRFLSDMGLESYWGVPLRDSSGGIVGILAVMDDRPMAYSTKTFSLLNGFAARIAAELERDRTEQALRESEQHYRDLFENLTSGFAVHEMLLDGGGIPCDYRFLEVNPAFERLTGLKAADVVGRTVREVMPGIEPHWIETYGKVAMTGRSVTFEHFAGDIGKHYAVTAYAPRIGQFAVIFVDVSEQKQLEAHLRQAQKIEAIGTLAGGIAHDFNNILYPMLGFTELLKEDLPPDSPLQTYIDEILQATLRSRDLVKQILAFSRKGEQKPRQLMLQPVVSEVLKLLRSSIPSTIRIEQRLDPDCGPVIADPTQLHQIIMNLGTNAYHAMEACGGNLAFELNQVRLVASPGLPGLAPGDYACLRVIDTGTGIEKEILERVFEPYFTTKEVGKGTGLGLSIVQGIVRSNKGDIRITSEPGKGTEVQVYLPVLSGVAVGSHLALAEVAEGGKESILLVDDEESISRMLRRVLERLGYRVRACNGSFEALELFKADSAAFDLVITDMTMPGMTGLRLAEELISTRADIPIILCTGFDVNIDRQKALSFGIKGILNKPVSRTRLSEMVRQVLDAVIPGT